MHEPVKVTINCYCTKLAIFLQYCLWDLVSEGSFVSLKTLSVLLCCHLDIPLMFPWKLPSSWMSLYSPCCLLRYMFFFPIAVKACRRGLKKNPVCFQCSDWSAGHWPKVEFSSMQRSVFKPFPDCLSSSSTSAAAAASPRTNPLQS